MCSGGSPVKLHELPAGVGHVVHLQVGSHGQHSRDHAWCQRETWSVHEVKQQGDTRWIQGVWERHGDELLPTATTPLTQQMPRVQGVEEPAAKKKMNLKKKNSKRFQESKSWICPPTCKLPAQRSEHAAGRCQPPGWCQSGCFCGGAHWGSAARRWNAAWTPSHTHQPSPCGLHPPGTPALRPFDLSVQKPQTRPVCDH